MPEVANSRKVSTFHVSRQAALPAAFASSRGQLERASVLPYRTPALLSVHGWRVTVVARPDRAPKKMSEREAFDRDIHEPETICWLTLLIERLVNSTTSSRSGSLWWFMREELRGAAACPGSLRHPSIPAAFDESRSIISSLLHLIPPPH